jgi:hypothetical protein
MSAILLTSKIDRPNWQDWGGRWERRNTFMRNLKMMLEDLDVHYTMPIQPVLLPRSMVTRNWSQGRGNHGGYFDQSPSSSQLHVPSSPL